MASINQTDSTKPSESPPPPGGSSKNVVRHSLNRPGFRGGQLA
jgi:hypothetical protein